MNTRHQNRRPLYGASLNHREAVRLQKLLALSRSSSDAEALAALRKAEALMARHGLSLDDLVDRLRRSKSALLDTRSRMGRLEMQLELERARERDIPLHEDYSHRKSKSRSASMHASLLDVCHHMIRHCDLKAYERRLLEKIEEVRPRSKEAHLVMICANRYGVVLEDEPHMTS